MTTRRSFLKLLGLISAGAVLPKQAESPAPAPSPEVVLPPMKGTRYELAKAPVPGNWVGTPSINPQYGYIVMKSKGGVYRIPVYDHL